MTQVAVTSISSFTDSNFWHCLVEHSSSSGSVLSSRKHRYSDEASDTSSSEYSSPSFCKSIGDTTENQSSTLTMGSEFADINHLKLSDGNLSRQFPKSDTSKHPTQFRSSDGEVTSETFSISDLRCDESVLVEDEDDVDFCVSSPAAKHEDEGHSEMTGKQLLKINEKTTTAGWFVSEGEGILLAHADGLCSYYDVANMEVCLSLLSLFFLHVRTVLVCLVLHERTKEMKSVPVCSSTQKSMLTFFSLVM